MKFAKRISKYLLAVIAITAICQQAVADDKGKALVDRAGSALKEYADYKVVFTVAYDGIDDIEGEYTVSRDRYEIKIDDQRQFSDGKSRYEVYLSDREVIIDKLDLASSNILTNPTRAFDFAPGEFNAKHMGEAVRNGKKCERVVLTPLKPMPGVTKITLYTDIASGLPAAVDYSYEGQDIRININSIEKLKSVDESIFRFVSSDYKGFEVIDFR